jgi:Leucine rich repeat
MSNNSNSGNSGNNNTEKSPVVSAVEATPCQDEVVMEDLRQRGMADHATEILRLTASDNDNSEAMVDDQQQDEEERREKMQMTQDVLVNPNPKSLKAPWAEPMVMMDTSSAHGNRKKQAKTPTSPTSSTAKEEDALASSQRQQVLDAAGTSPMASLANRSISMEMVPPTRLARDEWSGRGLSSGTNSHPGAYAVMPMFPFGHSNENENSPSNSNSNSNSNASGDREGQNSQEDDDNTTDGGSSLAGQNSAHDGRSTQNSNHGNDEESGALEAVRVDDIMTVKAEPLDDRPRSKLHKTIACVACAVVALVLIVTIAVTVGINDNDAASGNGPTDQPTYYDAETRFQLIQNLLLTKIGPLYNVNYNTTNGTKLLQVAFHTSTSPQHRALDWVARKDPGMEYITRPFLDDYKEIRRADDIFQGRRRQLSGISLPIHDRVVQRYVLAVLFYSTGNWTNSFEFLSAGSECDWSGALQCEDTNTNATDVMGDGGARNNFTSVGGITHVDLRNNNLEGTIPLEIAALSHLESLSLASNLLTGTLPPALAALSGLQSVDLGGNQFSGTIPNGYYQNWGHLESLIMSENILSGTISSYIGNWGNLKELRMERNHIGGAIPPQFWQNLTKMEDLDMAQQLEGDKFVNESFATEIGLWSNLRTFSFHNLALIGTVPTEFGLLVNLTGFQIAANHLSGPIPSELGLLTAVTQLSLSLNGLTGTVPTDFLRLTSLTMLYLQNTWLTGNVSFLCKGIEDGILQPMDPMRVDMEEVSGCACCTCCMY